MKWGTQSQSWQTLKDVETSLPLLFSKELIKLNKKMKMHRPDCIVYYSIVKNSFLPFLLNFSHWLCWLLSTCCINMCLYLCMRIPACKPSTKRVVEFLILWDTGPQLQRNKVNKFWGTIIGDGCASVSTPRRRTDEGNGKSNHGGSFFNATSSSSSGTNSYPLTSSISPFNITN